MSADKNLSNDDTLISSLSNILKSIETEYDAYESLIYALVLFSSSTGGFIDLDSSMDYFDVVCGAIRSERHGATSSFRFWDYEIPQKGKMVHKENISLYNIDGTLIGLVDPKYNFETKTVSLAVLLTKNSIDSSSKVTSLKDSHFRDPLTGVHNRISFEKDIQHASQFKQRFNKTVYLLYIDLNNFKIVNDKLGHGMGDRVLKSIASSIQKCTTSYGHLYRIGGDEFCVILRAVEKEQCNKLSERIQKIVYQSPGGILVDCSVGIEEFNGQSIEQLLEDADNKMYENKKSKKKLRK